MCPFQSGPRNPNYVPRRRRTRRVTGPVDLHVFISKRPFVDPAQTYVSDFEDALQRLKIITCPNCLRQGAHIKLRMSGMVRTRENREEHTVQCCERCFKNPIEFNQASGTQPELQIPPEFVGLTFVEELLISSAVHDCHIVLLGTSVHGIAKATCRSTSLFEPYLVSKLPRDPATLELLIIVQNEGVRCQDLIVRKDKVFGALEWLKLNNRYFSNIEIDYSVVLPIEGATPASIKTINISSDSYTIGEAKLDFHFVQQDIESDHSEDQLTREFLHQILDSNHLLQSRVNHRAHSIHRRRISTDDEGFLCRAYPFVFPRGFGAPGSASYGAAILSSKCKNFAYLLDFKDQRFALHARLKHSMYNIIHRAQIQATYKVCVKRNNEHSSHISAPQIQQLSQAETQALVEQITRFVSHISGSIQWHHQRKAELYAMIYFKNVLPTFFVTISASFADFTELQRLLNEAGVSEPFANDNPISIRYFCKMIKTLIKKVMTPLLSIEDFWCIYEWGDQGNIHCHMTIWSADVPPSTSSDQDALVDWLSSRIVAWNPLRDHEPMEQQSQRDVDQNSLPNLINRVQRHWQCSAPSCLRVQPNGEMRCRHNFPRDLTDQPHFHRGRFIPRSNDALINYYHPIILRACRSNMDIQFVHSLHGLVSYVTKGSTMERREHDIDQALNLAADHLQHVDIDHQMLACLTSKRRCITSSELTFHLLGLSGYHCSRTFETYNLDSNGALNLYSKCDESGLFSLGIDVSQLYRHNRPINHWDLCLYDLCSSYDPKKSWKKRSKPVVIKFITTLSGEPGTAKFQDFCRNQLRIYSSNWTSDRALLTQNNVEHLTFSDAYASFLQTRSDQLKFHGHLEKIQSIPNNQRPANPSRSSQSHGGSIMPTGGSQSRTNISRLESELVGPFRGLSFTQMNRFVKSLNDRQHLAQRSSLNIGQTIEETSRLHLEHSQLQAFNFITSFLAASLDRSNGGSGQHDHQIKAFVTGTAGSGKSALIKSITSFVATRFGEEALDRSIKIVSPTGCAASLVGGTTIHHLFRLPSRLPNNGDLVPLNGAALAAFQSAIQGVKLIICDEISMIGLRLLGGMERRLQQIRSDPNGSVFGGISYLFVGDFAQLHPIADRPMYCEPNDDQSGLQALGRRVFSSITTCFRLQQIFRVDPNQQAFIALLGRLRDGRITPADFDLLVSRFHSRISDSELESFKDAVYIVDKKDKEQTINEARLAEIEGPLIQIPCQSNTREGFNATSDLAGNLLSTLSIKVGCKVILTRNICVGKGLFNGATGIVSAISLDSSGCVSSVGVEFGSFRGPSLVESRPQLVPVLRCTHSWKNSSGRPCYRKQFPLRLAFSLTIHRCQGLTLPRCVIDIGSSEWAVGLSFVALSRVKRLEDLVLVATSESTFTWRRFEQINEHNKEDRIRRMETEDYLYNLTPTSDIS